MLHDFKNKPFITALKSFFESLNVPFNSISDYQTSPEVVIGEKKCNDIIDTIYPFGIVTDAIFDYEAVAITQSDLKKDKYEGILLFGVEISKEKPTRSDLAEITRQINREFAQTPVVVVFKYGNQLTFANAERLDFKQTWREGEKVGKVSMLKDIQIEKPHAAHKRILLDLKNKNANSFDELYAHWQKVLNTKELNDTFYNDLFKWYLYAKDYVVFPNDNNEDADKYLSESLIRFVSRLLFVWFMKEKSLIPNEFFDKNSLKNILINFDETNSTNTYYKAILQNLFFATLNVPINDRKWISSKKSNKSQKGDPLIYRYENEFIDSDAIINSIFMKIPFLNGGLFDCLDDREQNMFVDGFTKNEKKQPSFQNKMFFGKFENINLSHHFDDDAKEKKKWQNVTVFGIIDLLNNYKFTIEENTPLEIDVALDPELLGKVFENLLASFNPETKATARKQTGSFYTPREIVNYMVDESLNAYLENVLPASSWKTEQNALPASSWKNETETDIGFYNQNCFFNPNNEIIIYRKKLPHWQQENVWYFVTFRLGDSIPEEKKQEIIKDRAIWESENKGKNKKNFTKADWIKYNQLFHEKTEVLLNSGYGKCWLNKKENADIMVNALLHFNNERYILDEWVIMPNHVHVLVKPIGEHYLGDILHSWKSFTANEINKREGISGPFWMSESHDHIVRNKTAFDAIKKYIKQNPEKAGITVHRASSSEVQAISLANDPSVRARSSEHIAAIYNCKILDPACGSGAFPMGILHKMVALLAQLDPKNEYLKEIEGKKLDALIKNAQRTLSDTKTRNQTVEALQKQIEILQNAQYDYVRKLYIIENCIHGVDIQPIAIQISKLRFFISLLVEQQKDETQPNSGIEPLPNMDFKLVAANTLISPPQEDKADQTGLFAEQDTFFETFKELAHDYFTLFTPESKKQKKEEIKTLINAKIEEKKRLVNSVKSAKVLQDSVELWESYQNLFKEKAVGFFDIPYFFPEVKDGFDIVIGNPPYIQMQKDGGKLADLYKNQNYKTFERTGDIYSLFYENGINLLTENGNLNFITSNKWMRAKYGESLRTFFTKHNPAILIDLGAGVFENATVDTNILLINKQQNQNNCTALDLTKEKNITDFDTYKNNWTILSNLSKDAWALLSNAEHVVKQKIESIGTPLKDWDINIYRGILTGFNEAFIIDTATKEQLCNEDSKSIDIIKPILRGKDIKKYQDNWAGLWLISSHNGYKENDKKIPKINIDDYPAVRKHLDRYLPQLTNRGDKGETPYNLRNCAYMAEFNKEKIVWKAMGMGSDFTYINEPIYTNDKGNLLTSNSNDLKYILAYLNSKIFLWQYSFQGISLGNGFEFKVQFVEKIPVPKLLKNEIALFTQLVDQILNLKKQNQDTKILEHQIDVMVYHLYELSYEEALIIDAALSEEDFEKFKI